MRTIVANVAAAGALVGANMAPALELVVLSNAFQQKTRFLYDPLSTATDGAWNQSIINPVDNVGRFVRSDPIIDLMLPVSFLTNDGDVLFTVPDGMTLLPLYDAVFLEVLTPFAGGAASTIGLSLQVGTAPALNRTKGNLAGGAACDAGFTAISFFQPTIGSQFGAGKALQPILSPGSQVFFDRIVSAFTAGAGYYHVPCLNYPTTIVPVAPP